MGHRTFVMVASVAVAISGCGTAGNRPARPASPYVAATPVPTTSTAVVPTTTSAPPIARIDRPATATTPADRLENGVVLVWIGGSDVVIGDRSLPAAVSKRLMSVGDRPLTLIPDTLVAPLPRDIQARVTAATRHDIDGLIVALNVSWTTWDGHDDCDGITPAYPFYVCVLTPPPPAAADALLADVRALIDTIVDTGLPAYVYIIPHSAESLADPSIAGLITTAEAKLASLDPHVDRIEFAGRIATRDLPGMHEGVDRDFFDMVHPTVAGMEALADWMAPELDAFWTAALS